jgi:hypothetical protein
VVTGRSCPSTTATLSGLSSTIADHHQGSAVFSDLVSRGLDFLVLGRFWVRAPSRVLILIFGRFIGSRARSADNTGQTHSPPAFIFLCSDFEFLLLGPLDFRRQTAGLIYSSR